MKTDKVMDINFNVKLLSLKNKKFVNIFDLDMSWLQIHELLIVENKKINVIYGS